ncbi:MAG: cupin domain-containing protein [Aestuariibacter sp.]
MSVKKLIDTYQLQPHPEGGYFRETYRSPEDVASPVHGQQRAVVTQIYFLLGRDDISRFHKVFHDEIWHFYDGAPLRLIDLHEQGASEIILGGNSGRYHHVISGGHYQAAESTGDYSLVGGTVAPGFDFADFKFLSDDGQSMQSLEPHYRPYRRFI